jgi:tetratricopeptide (TPR) repeat protein
MLTTDTIHEFQSRRDLGVAWMNRGHELMLRGDPASLAAALDAYNEAIRTLRPLVGGSDLGRDSANPAWANSLAAALMNRGHLLHRLHGIDQAALALAAFDEAAAILRLLCGSELARDFSPSALQPFSPSSPWPRRNLAGTLLNRANLLLDLADLTAAASAAREALALAAPQERTDPVDADLALKSRRALCDALGRLVVTPEADHEALAGEASDLVDDAMALTRHWTDRGEAAFAPLALRFFHYGTQLYRFHQPQFLAEFIRENLSPAHADFRAIALAAIDSALADRPAGFLTVGDPASERRLEIWRELASLRSHLAA